MLLLSLQVLVLHLSSLKLHWNSSAKITCFLIFWIPIRAQCHLGLFKLGLNNRKCFKSSLVWVELEMTSCFAHVAHWYLKFLFKAKFNLRNHILIYLIVILRTLITWLNFIINLKIDLDLIQIYLVFLLTRNFIQIISV